MKIRADAIRKGTDLLNDVGAVFVVEDAYVRVPGREDDPTETIALVLKRAGHNRELHFYPPDQLLDLGPAHL